MQARFYAPWYGRFLSPDPARDQHFEETQSWNIYSYVQNNPTMKIDPDGQQAIPTGGGLMYYNLIKAGVPPAEAKQIMQAQNNGKAVGAAIGVAVQAPVVAEAASPGLMASIGGGLLSAGSWLKDKAVQAKDAVVNGLGAAKDAASNMLSKSSVSFDWGRAGHIFREAEGHLNPSTAQGQQAAAKMFESVASNSKNLVNTADAVSRGIMTADAAKNGVQAFVQTTQQGQTWVLTRGNAIVNAGVNALKDQK